MVFNNDANSYQPGALLHWAERVRPEKIRRLYELEARGILDEEFLDDIFYALYARCQSILVCTEAAAGKVKCPRCGAMIQRNDLSNSPQSKAERMVCSDCDWISSWGEFQSSYQGKKLFAGGAGPALQVFVDSAHLVKLPRDKMVLIDNLIHAYHWEATLNPTKPVAVNMIVGNIKEIIELFEKLAYGQNELEMRRTKLAWEEKTRVADEKWHKHQYAGLLDIAKDEEPAP